MQTVHTLSDQEFNRIRFWHNLNPSKFEPIWNSLPGWVLREKLQQHGPLWPGPTAREWLDKAIRRLHQDPTDWPAHLVLLQQGRIYSRLTADLSVAPASFAQWVQEYRQQQALLEVFPPVSSTQVTILLPTYNRLHQLKHAVESVQRQSRSSWQLLIADDGSTDGTELWCRMLAESDPRILYLRKEQNTGLSDTLNLLYQECPTELVMSLADDDCLMPICLEATLNLFERFPWIAMAGGGYYYLHFKNKQLLLKQFGPYYDTPCLADTQLELQRTGLINPIFGGGALFRKAQLLKRSAADQETKNSHFSAWDWLLISEFLGHYEVGYSPEIAAAYVDHYRNDQFTRSHSWGYPFLQMLERIVKRYEALFGRGTYPREIIDYFLLLTAGPYLVQSFQNMLDTHQEPQDIENFVASQRAAWELHRQLRMNYSQPGESDAALLSAESFAGLTRGEIPGLKTGKTPPALQHVLENILR